MCCFTETYAETEILEENNTAVDKTELHITEETDDDVFVHTPTSHTTEDLFTIIHRYNLYFNIHTDTLFVCFSMPNLA